MELSTAQCRGIFELESVNTMRLDDYFTLDVRIDRTEEKGARRRT